MEKQDNGAHEAVMAGLDPGAEAKKGQESDTCPQCGGKWGIHYFYCQTYEGQRVGLQDYLLDPSRRKVLATPEELLRFDPENKNLKSGYTELFNTLGYSSVLAITKEGMAIEIPLKNRYIREACDFATKQTEGLGTDSKSEAQRGLILGGKTNRYLETKLKELLPGLELSYGRSLPLQRLKVDKMSKSADEDEGEVDEEKKSSALKEKKLEPIEL